MKSQSVALLGATALGVAAVYAYITFRKKQKMAFEDLNDDDDEKASTGIKRKVLLLGLQGSGKSSLLAALSKNMPEEMPVTKGFNVLKVKIKGVDFEIWDIGASAQRYWNNFYANTDLVVFVVDSTDSEGNKSYTRDCLHVLLTEPLLENVPKIVVGNKQDLPNAKTVDEMSEALNLTESAHRIPIIGTKVPLNQLQDGTATYSDLESHLHHLA